MFKNYLKMALRNIKKEKIFTVVNILGLTIGISCCLVIYQFVAFETGYDKYHQDLDRIFRVAIKVESTTGTQTSAQTCSPTAMVIKNHFPDVERVARIIRVSPGLVKYKDRSFYEGNRMYADNELFEILTVPFLQGDKKTALSRPATAVISKRMSQKYFGNKNPVGETININMRDFEITGIIKDPPTYTHLKYDFFLSMKTLDKLYPFDAWFLSNMYTYIKLKPGTKPSEFSNKIRRLAHIYAPKNKIEPGGTVTNFLQPVGDIHLHSHLRNETEPSLHPFYITIFSLIALFILIIACINFINLSTARAVNRIKEVGMRKVIGAQRPQLVTQFLSETLITAFLSFVLALTLVESLIPFLNNLAGIPFISSSFLNIKTVILFFIFSLLVGLAAGIYPAFFLSAFRPASILRSSSITGTHRSWMRNTLVVTQFAISIFLIIGTVTVYRQLLFMKNHDLGFSKNQKLILPARIIARRKLTRNYETIKKEFLRHTHITGAACSSEVPGQRGDRWDTQLIGEKNSTWYTLNYVYVGHDFPSQYDLTLIAGRSFDKKLSTDLEKTCLINQAAVKEFGWASPQEAIGKRIKCTAEFQIIGVVKDFHYQGLQSVIEPLGLALRPSRFEAITLTVKTEDINKTIGFLKNKWQESFPGEPFEYFFLDDRFNQHHYSQETRIGKLFSTFTLLGLFIACLGLLGLAAFTTQQKTKEIGIRKVLGASTSKILMLLSRQFITWVLVANIIAWPLGYIAMKSWLQKFAYRIDMGIFPFIFSAIIALLVALFTVSMQSTRAALANPIESLKYE